MGKRLGPPEPHMAMTLASGLAASAAVVTKVHGAGGLPAVPVYVAGQLGSALAASLVGVPGLTVGYWPWCAAFGMGGALAAQGITLANLHLQEPALAVALCNWVALNAAMALNPFGE